MKIRYDEKARSVMSDVEERFPCHECPDLDNDTGVSVWGCTGCDRKWYGREGDTGWPACKCPRP
jgi:ribosomal protein L37AE/L43A